VVGLILCCCFTLCGTARAQVRSRSARSRLLFDSQTTRLPPGFHGDSPSEAYAHYQLRPKGEYETSVQFRARVGWQASGRYAFVLDHSCYNNYVVEYSPDEGVLRVAVNLSRPDQVYRNPHAAAWLSLTCYAVKYLGRTAAQNGFGMTFDVLRLRRSDYEVALVEALRRSGHGTVNDATYHVTFRIPLSPAEARRVRPNLRLLAVVSTTSPDGGTVSVDTGYTNSTADDPRDITTIMRTIFVQDVELWVFDSRTGNVLSKARIPTPCPGDCNLSIEGPGRAGARAGSPRPDTSRTRPADQPTDSTRL
jgi:hypothetical protein